MLPPTAIHGASSGWLAPDGQFFQSSHREHEMIAWQLAEAYGYARWYEGSRALERNGWAKLEDGVWTLPAGGLTQPQTDAHFDWTVSRIAEWIGCG